MSATRRPPPSIVVLAAGESRRMRGDDKLLRFVDGTPLVLRAVRAACAAARDVVVVVPPRSPRAAWLSDTAARLVEVGPRAMSASIAAGVAACPPGAVMIHLADMPEIDAGDLHAVSEAWQACDALVLRAASADGMPGHPVVFDASLRIALAHLRGDRGAFEVVEGIRPSVVRLRSRHACVDLDTPEAWNAWLATKWRDRSTEVD